MWVCVGVDCPPPFLGHLWWLLESLHAPFSAHPPMTMELVEALVQGFSWEHLFATLWLVAPIWLLGALTGYLVSRHCVADWSACALELRLA